MNQSPLYIAILAALSTSTLSSVSYAETDKLKKITVAATAEEAAPQEDTHASAELLENGNSETGDVLRQINGVSAARKGGHGLDPQIRGQQYSQLNILLDGAKIEGGCPNRMDPPTSYSEVSSYDEVVVIRGVNSVLNGPGGSGGTILFNRLKPTYNPDKPVSGEVSVGKSNILNYETNAEVQAVGKTGYVVVQGSRKDANNYTDGNGDVVKSSYNTNQGHVDLGWTPNENHHLKLSAEKSRTEDALYPGAAMDAPETEGTMLRLKYEGRQLSEAIADVDVDLYRSTVDHVMNNFDLRTPPSPMMKRETPTSTESNGAKVKLTSHVGKTQFDYGLQLESVNKDATLWNRSVTPNTSLNYMWPDVTNTTKSLFAETNTLLSQQSNLIFGLRYDQVNVKANDTNSAPTGAPGNMPSLVYAKTYSDYNGENTANEDNLSGLLRFENTFASNYKWYLGASHTKRTADATERFMSKWGMMSGTQTSWVGNPNIKPEQHNQIDLGIGQKTAQLNWNVSVWYDKVNDYILRDLATNQYDNGVKTTAKDQTEVYVNIDAELYGADLEADYRMTSAFTAGGQFSLTKGRNTTDNRNIAMISAPTGSLHATYRPSNWHLGGRFNFALEQTDIDKAYTPEANHGETPAWSMLDIYGGYQLSKTWQINAGIDNLMDHAYYDHLSYDPVDPTVYKNNEPGRNYWAKVTAKF